MAVLFAVIAALAYGVSDFVGGIASRRVTVKTVLLISTPSGTILMACLLPSYGGPVSTNTLLWSIAGGVAGLSGVALLYAGLARAPMNIISPVTAVMSAVVPVFGGLVLGERPHLLAWFGIALGLAAIVCISRQPDDHPHGPVGWQPLIMAMGAGIGFGMYFICLARSDPNSGIWPVVLSRLTSFMLLLPLAVMGIAASGLTRIPGKVLMLALLAGVLDATANVAFLLASRHGLLSLSAVITSLYPAGTVLLAIWILKEHSGWLQKVGFAVAALSIVCITS
jgi:drug/metabolite transporter (DMT)-like permease